MPVEKTVERRTCKMTGKKFQSRFIRLTVISLGALLAVSLSVFYLALRARISHEGLSGYTRVKMNELLVWLNFALPAAGLLIIVAAGIISKHISFKVAGPLYALEKQLRMLNEGLTDRIRLRSDDDHELLPVADLINSYIEKKSVEPPAVSDGQS